MNQPKHVKPRFIRGIIRLAAVAERIKPDRSFPQGSGTEGLHALLQDMIKGVPYMDVRTGLESMIIGLPDEMRAEVVAMFWNGAAGVEANEFDAYVKHARNCEDLILRDELSGADIAGRFRRAYRLIWPDEPEDTAASR